MEVIKLERTWNQQILILTVVEEKEEENNDDDIKSSHLSNNHKIKDKIQ